jgi:anti-sigma-K factor RskA
VSGATPEQLREMATGYVLGALSDGDARAFAAFLETSPEAQREVAELRDLLPVLASAIEGPRPSASLRARVIAHATRASARLSAPPASTRPIAPARTMPVAWLALAASLVALIGVSVSHMQLRSDLAARDSAVASLTRELAQTQALRIEAQASLTGLLDTHTTYTRLIAQGTSGPDVRLFCNWHAQVAFASAAGLAPNASGRVYQLWFIPKAGAPIPSVTFTVDAAGNAQLVNIALPDGQELAAAAVTDEPTGGSPQPTTTPFLVGTL